MLLRRRFVLSVSLKWLDTHKHTYGRRSRNIFLFFQKPHIKNDERETSCTQVRSIIQTNELTNQAN